MDGSSAPAGWTLWRVAKYVLIALGVLIALFFAAIGYAWWWMSGGVFTPDRFDAQTWSRRITKAEDSSCYRGGMGADIRDRILRPGMSRAEVERLLGEPDNSSNPNEYWYVLGMCSGFQIDYDALHIYFDAKDTVERALILQH